MPDRYTLKNWHFEDGIVSIIYGNVYDNPNFPNGYYIHTSKVESVEDIAEENAFMAITKSGSHYILPYDSMMNADAEQNRGKLSSFGLDISDEKWNKMLEMSNNALAAQKQEQALRLDEFKKGSVPGSLYLEFNCNEIQCAYFHADGDEEDVPEFYALKPYCHVGTFQDSYIIADGKYGKMDYRYFPIWNDTVETYHWSSSIKEIWVRNTGDTTIAFDEYQILAGETKRVKRNNPADGLLSPDMVVRMQKSRKAEEKDESA